MYDVRAVTPLTSWDKQRGQDAGRNAAGLPAMPKPTVSRHQGRRHGFLSGEGRIVGRWLTYPQSTLKIGKGTGFGSLHPRIWRGRPLLNLSLGDASSPPPAFDAHARHSLSPIPTDGSTAAVGWE